MAHLSRKARLLLLVAVVITCQPVDVLATNAQGRKSRVPPTRLNPVPIDISPDPDDVCDDFSGAAFALCNVFCEVLECDVRSLPACEIVRRNFDRLTFRDQFPCEVVAPSPTATITRTSTSTVTATATATLTPTATEAADTPTNTPTSTPTGVPTGTASATLTATATATDTPGDTATATATSTATAVSTSTATTTPTTTGTPTATNTGVPTGTAATSTATATATNTAVNTSTATATTTPVNTSTATPTTTGTAVNTSTATTTPTATNTGVPTGTAATSTSTATPTSTPVNTSTATATNTAANTSTATATGTAANTSTATATSTSTAVNTSTATSTPTSTNTGVPTGTAATSTATATVTNTPVNTATSTSTSVSTATNTPTPTSTPLSTNTATPTPTVTPSATPTPTDTPVPCPLAQGSYTLTQVSGGNLTVDGLPAFPFPAGGVIVQDVLTGNADCVHQTIVPFPGGFDAPAFCIPALGFTTSVEQTGCGIGRVDSNGGSDFTITERGDTSSPNTCALPHLNCQSGADSNVQVNVTVGNAAVDTCSSGTANATVSVPVFTTTWLKFGQCPDADGVFNPGTDTLIVSFPQTLDFTTDSTSADWTDLDPDGCCIAGAGPGSNTNPCNAGGTGGFSGTGTCIDVAGIGVAGVDVTTVASGTIGSSGSPLYDLTFITQLPNEMTGPAALQGATCTTPPAVDFAGTVTRCIGPPASPSTSERALRLRQRGLPLFSDGALEGRRTRSRRSSGGS